MPLCEEIEQFIDAWVNDLDGIQPTEAQEQEIRNFICNLDNRVENDRPTKRARQAKDDDDDDDTDNNSNKTTDDRLYDRTTKTSSEPTTLKELVQYTLQSFDDERLKELNFMVVTLDSPCIFFKSRVEFETALDDVQSDLIHSVALEGSIYGKESLKQANNHIAALLCPPDKLVKKINAASKSFHPSKERPSLEWSASFVEAIDPHQLYFVGDASKDSALVVAGESGSGKTWFSKNYVPTKLGKENLAMIYYSVEDNDGHKLIKADDIIKNYAMAYQKCMRYLKSGEGEVYECVSKLSMKYRYDRDEMSHQWLNDRIGSILDRDKEARLWWNSDDTSKFKPVDKLVVVIDDLGRNPELARGLVSKVRQISSDMTSRKAREFLLVLVGSGLDFYIRKDTHNNKFSSFGTDPGKSRIITLKGPNLR